MRIEFNYNKYNDSERATNLSHIANYFLAFLFPAISVINIAAIGLIGDATIKMLKSSEAVADSLIFILLCAIAAIAAETILLLLKVLIDLVCDRIAIHDTYWDLSAQEKKTIAKNNAKNRWDMFWWIIKRFLFYTPLAAAGITCIVVIYYSLTNDNTSMLIVPMLVLALDAFACVFFRKRLFK
ncbi:MAG: hypothetical protein Q3977_02670 [Oscillospiraceae bacterium]|nr:hypothetical protein [Oscillospiraceae bacterium]